jgi:Domain of unknown function (DUF4214)
MFANVGRNLRRQWKNSGRARRASHPVPLSLEALENRLVPSSLPAGPGLAFANQVFLATVYQGELQRPIDSVGLAAWGNELNQGASRAQVVGAILSSNEYFRSEITTDYESLLGRAPDPSGLSYFTQALEEGATPQTVQAAIMGSDEFFARVSGDLTSFLEETGGAALQSGSVAQAELTAYRFLNAVYGEVLNRPVDATGLAGWFPLAGNAAGRTEIVSLVEASPEAANLAVSTIYENALGRTPDPGGLAYWAGQLEKGASESTVLAAVLGSDELFSRMESYTAQLNSTDPNVAAAKFISAAQLFRLRPAVVPAAPPPVAASSTGDSGYDTPPPDNSGGNVVGCDNSGGNTTIPDDSIPPPTAPDSSGVDTSSDDGSTTDSTDTSSSDGSCDTGDPSGCDSGSTDDSSDPGSDC